MRLKTLYKDTIIVLRATKGTGTFSESSIYTGGLDPDFKNWGLDRPGKPSPEIEIGIKETVSGNGTFAEIFAEIGDIKNIIIPQDQARNFVVEHRDKIFNRRASWMLFTKGDDEPSLTLSNVFVACVCVQQNGPRACLYRYSQNSTRYGMLNYRVVFRQQ